MVLSIEAERTLASACSARQHGLDFGKSLRDFAGLNRHTELPRHLRCGKKAAEALPALCIVFDDQRMLAACFLEGRHDMADLGAAYLVEIQHLEPLLRGHDVAHLNLAPLHAALHSNLYRFLPKYVGRRNEPRYISVLVNHQEQTYSALDHPAMRLVDGVAWQDDDSSHFFEVGRHLNGGRFQRDFCRKNLRRPRVRDAQLQHVGFDWRVIPEHGSLAAFQLG